MAHFSIWHWLIIFTILAVPSALFARVIAKAGFSRWWALLGLVPLINVIALWLFAFGEWPAQAEAEQGDETAV